MRIILLLAGIFWSTGLWSQSPVDSSDHPGSTVAASPTDETTESDKQDNSWPPTTPRQLPAKWVPALASEKGFEYLPYIDSALRHRKPDPMVNKVEEQPKSTTANKWLRPTLWSLSLIALLYLLLKLWTERRKLFNPANTRINKHLQEEDDPLLVASAASLAAAAMEKKEYRLATRYLFADALMRLGEKEKLKLQARKTNSEYLNEVQQPDMQADLAKLMLLFEYVWYGGFIPSEVQFQTIYTNFKKFDARWL